MHRWVRFLVRWKLAVGVAVPLLVVLVGVVTGNPARAVKAGLLVGAAFGVLYPFARDLPLER